MKDKDYADYFVTSYDQMHRWVSIKVGGQMLNVGADNYIFPIPLGQNPSGQWYFDTAAGKDEILARRIGKDELTAIAACGAVADAENQYFSHVRRRRQGKTVRPEAHQRRRQAKRIVLAGFGGPSPSPLEDGSRLCQSCRVHQCGQPSRSRSMATTSAYSPNRETRQRVARRTTS